MPSAKELSLTGSRRLSPGLRWARRAGVVLGLILLIAAIVMAWRQREMLRQAMNSIQDMPADRRAALIAAVLATVLANVVLTGLLFSALMARYGRVGIVEMQAVMASATLLNYVPMRPGLFGRIAYHRISNQVPVADSAKVIVQSAILSALSAGYVALTVGLHQWGTSQVIPLWVIACLPVAALPLLWLMGATGPALLLLAAGLRYLDVLVMALRYWAAFALLGAPIDFAGALAFACISMAAMMVPFLSNGLGLREWAIGLAAPLLTAHHMALGITADLINRAAEMIIIVPAGLFGLAMVARFSAARTRCDEVVGQ